MVFFILTMNVHFKNESCQNERKNTPYDRGMASSSRRKQGARRSLERVGSTASIVESRSRATPREPAAGTLTGGGGMGEGKTSRVLSRAASEIRFRTI